MPIQFSVAPLPELGPFLFSCMALTTSNPFSANPSFAAFLVGHFSSLVIVWIPIFTEPPKPPCWSPPISNSGTSPRIWQWWWSAGIWWFENAETWGTIVPLLPSPPWPYLRSAASRAWTSGLLKYSSTSS